MEKQFLDNLIQGMRAGRDSARIELWQQYEPQVIRLVRRYLRPGTAPSPLQRRIHAAAEAVGELGCGEHGDQRVRRVAWRFCESLLEPAGMSDPRGLPH